MQVKQEWGVRSQDEVIQPIKAEVRGKEKIGSSTWEGITILLEDKLGGHHCAGRKSKYDVMTISVAPLCISSLAKPTVAHE